MTEFLEAFLPNLVSTILGVVLGLPVALFVNARLTASQRRHETLSERSQRNIAIDVLATSCTYNIGVLNRMAELALAVRVLRNPDLRTTTWDSVGPILSIGGTDPDLLAQLSHHWLRLRRLEQLNDDLFKLSVGTLPQLEDREMMIGVWQELHDSSSILSLHAVELSERLMLLKLDSSKKALEPKRSSSHT